MLLFTETLIKINLDVGDFMNSLTNFDQFKDRVSFQRHLLSMTKGIEKQPLMKKSLSRDVSAEQAKMKTIVENFLTYGEQQGFTKTKFDKQRAEKLRTRLSLPAAPLVSTKALVVGGALVVGSIILGVVAAINSKTPVVAQPIPCDPSEDPRAIIPCDPSYDLSLSCPLSPENVHPQLRDSLYKGMFDDLDRLYNGTICQLPSQPKNFQLVDSQSQENDKSEVGEILHRVWKGPLLNAFKAALTAKSLPGMPPHR